MQIWRSSLYLMWQWEHQQRPLSASFRLITPDLIGSGLSAKPEIEYRPDQMLDYFVGFMASAANTCSSRAGI